MRSRKIAVLGAGTAGLAASLLLARDGHAVVLIEPADDDLQYIAVRRPLIEWGLRKAVLTQPGIEVISDLTVRGIRVDRASVRAVDVDGRALEVDIVVDAMGRRSPMPDWLELQ